MHRLQKYTDNGLILFSGHVAFLHIIKYLKQTFNKLFQGFLSPTTKVKAEMLFARDYLGLKVKLD